MGHFFISAGAATVHGFCASSRLDWLRLHFNVWLAVSPKCEKSTNTSIIARVLARPIIGISMSVDKKHKRRLLYWGIMW
jgi:hypothetical protein